ncbi:MAG TPA: hypothetical protein VGU46_07330 [Acidobacteriaceae bacterium]|nr:hypothetical protein [Acidobacteriaceae bacterium]
MIFLPAAPEGHTVKKLLCLCAALLVLFTTASAFAATDVTGTWDAQFTSADGSFVLDFVCTLKQDGTKVTGTLADPQGSHPPVEITDGKIDGDKLTFNVAYNGMVIAHEGKVTGDEIKLSEKSDSENFQGGSMVLKRAKGSAPAAVPAT